GTRMESADGVEELLVASDTAIRKRQMGLVYLGAGTIAVGCWIWVLGGLPAAGAVVGVLGLVPVVAATRVKQRWEVVHRGRRIRFENGILSGEALFVDGRLTDTAGFYYGRVAATATIHGDDGSRRRIVAATL